MSEKPSPDDHAANPWVPPEQEPEQQPAEPSTPPMPPARHDSSPPQEPQDEGSRYRPDWHNPQPEPGGQDPYGRDPHELDRQGQGWNGEGWQGQGWQGQESPGAGGHRWAETAPLPPASQQPTTDGVAVGALITAIVGLIVPLIPAVIAFVLAAHSADNLRGNRWLRGRGMVTAARATAAVALVVNVVSVGLLVVTRDGEDPTAAPTTVATTTTVAPTTTTLPPLSLSTLEIGVGHCLIAPKGDTFTEVEAVDCGVPHDSEVYAIEDLVELAGQPFDEAAIEAAVRPVCERRFQEYVGRDYATSTLDYTWHFPSEVGWTAGDLEIKCLVVSLDSSPLVGSVRGSGR